MIGITEKSDIANIGNMFFQISFFNEDLLYLEDAFSPKIIGKSWYQQITNFQEDNPKIRFKDNISTASTLWVDIDKWLPSLRDLSQLPITFFGLYFDPSTENNPTHEYYVFVSLKKFFAIQLFGSNGTALTPNCLGTQPFEIGVDNASFFYRNLQSVLFKFRHGTIDRP